MGVFYSGTCRSAQRCLTFGPLPDEKGSRVKAITSRARLKRLADQILTAKSLNEMGL